MISNNANVSLGIVGCSVDFRCIGRKFDCHKTIKNLIPIIRWSSIFLETQQKSLPLLLEKTNSFRKKVKQSSISWDFCCSNYKLWLHWIVNSQSLLVLETESQTNMATPRRSVTLHNDAIDNFRLNVTTMKAMNFQDDIRYFCI